MGKMSRRKGSGYERKVAHILEVVWDEKFKRTPLSGGWAKEKITGDIVPIDRQEDNFPFSIECKNQKAISVPKWLNQAKEDCPEGKIPLLIFHLLRDQDEYVCLTLTNFTNLIKDYVADSYTKGSRHDFREGFITVKEKGNEDVEKT